MNKLKRNRFERYIPETNGTGLLQVNSDENLLEFKQIDDLNITYGRDSTLSGFEQTIKDNKLTIKSGQLIASSKKVYKRIKEEQRIQIDVVEPFYGILSKEQFDVGTYIINDYEHLFSEKDYCGRDSSNIKYVLPYMTGENTPYGVTWADSYHATADYKPWKMFDSNIGGTYYLSKDPSTGLYPLCVYYTVMQDATKKVCPTKFTITNRNDKTVRPLVIFQIQGSECIHPYDDNDWDVLVDVDNVNIVHNKGQNVSTVYNVDCEKYYRHFRIKAFQVDGSGVIMCIGGWIIEGKTQDYMPFISHPHNYFLVKIKNNFNGEIKTGLLDSNNLIPELNGFYEILDFYPIEEDLFIQQDYSKSVFFNKKEEDILDLTDELTLPNCEYKVWFVVNDDNSYEYYIQKENDLPNNKMCKMIGKFKTDENMNIISYYRNTDICKDFNDKFIIDERLGQTGYRIYSDGWKEQWGNGTNPVFPLTFEQIPTNVTRGATNVTKTGMTLAAGYWQVKGY